MSNKKKLTRIVIMGAAGRDFHNFYMVYRDDPLSEVIASVGAADHLIVSQHNALFAG